MFFLGKIPIWLGIIMAGKNASFVDGFFSWNRISHVINVSYQTAFLRVDLSPWAGGLCIFLFVCL